MIITSLNLFGFFDDWNTRQSNIVAYLRATDPDIVFFQEVVYLPDISPYTQVSHLNHNLTFKYEHQAITKLQTSDEFSEYREGLAVLSKVPILKTETIVLRQDPSDHLQRIVQLVDIEYGSSIIKFANVHFSEHEALAKIHLKELLAILSTRNEQRIIMGDFNVADIESTKDLWQHAYTASTSTPYVSYPTMNKRIDYVLLPLDYQFESISTSPDTLSDHRALTVSINNDQSSLRV